MRKTGRCLMSFVSRLTSYASRSSNDSGVVLVLVLLIVTLITAMVVEFAYGVYVNTNALHNWQASQKLSFAAKSATRLASKLTSTNLIEQYKTRASFEISQKIPYGDLDGTITLKIEDENAKFNLNSLKNPDGYDFFVRLLTVLDLDPDIANMVSYWINASTEHRPKNSGSIKPKNAYLDSIDELLLIPGINRDSYDRLLPYVTIYGSDSNTFYINVNTADIPVIRSISDNKTISPEMAQRGIVRREVIPFSTYSEFTGALGLSTSDVKAGHIIYQSKAFHVIATGESGGIKRIVESVLEGNSVRYWKEM